MFHHIKHDEIVEYEVEFINGNVKNIEANGYLEFDREISFYIWDDNTQSKTKEINIPKCNILCYNIKETIIPKRKL